MPLALSCLLAGCVGLRLGLGAMACNAQHLSVGECVGAAGGVVGDVVAFQARGGAVCLAVHASVVVSDAGRGGDGPPAAGAGAAGIAVTPVRGCECLFAGVLVAVSAVSDEVGASVYWASAWRLGHQHSARIASNQHCC